MDNTQIIERLEHKGVKATANRILIYKALQQSSHPLCLTDMENMLDTLDKSSIFRTLTLFAENDVVHSFSDGRGVVHYELCTDENHCNHDHDHIHFYCERCQQTFCFENMPIPQISLPDGFLSHEISVVVKGMCPHCANKSKSQN